MFVFLDIDGVLNRSSQWNNARYPLHDECITAFAEYINQTRARIILTSTWRLGFLSPGNTGNTPQIRLLEAKLRDRGVRITGRTGDMGSRAREVNLFVKKYPNEKYVILDDEEAEYAKAPAAMKEHLYLVSSQTGFTRKDARALIGLYGVEVETSEKAATDAAQTARAGRRFFKRK